MLLKVLFWLVVGLLALVGAGTLWLALARSRLRLPSSADEVHYPVTADGWRLALWRYRPRTRPAAEAGRAEASAGSAWGSRAEATDRPAPLPVILCHGLWANRYNMHFDERLSLALYLADRGLDVFVLELRGTGRSGRPGYGAPKGADWDFDFDDHLAYDVPAAIERVCEVTGADRVFWVGHSMGGMLGYAAASGELAGRFAGLVAVGSPGTWRHQDGFVRGVVRSLVPLVPGRLPVARVSALLSPLAGWFHPPPAHVLMNTRNMDGRVVRRALFNLAGDLTRGQLRQFHRWMSEQRFGSLDGQVDYFARLSEVRTPVLLMAGGADRLAPPGSLRDVYERIGSEDRRLVILDEAGGVPDYGHGDLLLGRDAPRDVYAPILRWLGEHGAPVQPDDEPSVPPPPAG